MPPADRHRPLALRGIEPAGEVRHMNDREIKEAIDACRPGADDAGLPEMAGLAGMLCDDERARQLYERTQRSDAAIGHAFRNTSVPEGLQDRLLEAVQRQAAEPTQEARSFVDGAINEEQSPSEGGVLSVASRGAIRRRYLVGVGVCVAVAVAAVCFLFGGFGNGDGPLPTELPGEVEQWVREREQWTDWSENLAQAAHPYPQKDLIRGVPIRWRVVRTRYDSRAILYDITPPTGQGFAYVICIRARTTALPPLPPRFPISQTGGIAIGAWQSGGMVYVLAVKGGQARYQNFVGSGFEIG